jgi:hypothetical protein
VTIIFTSGGGDTKVAEARVVLTTKVTCDSDRVFLDTKVVDVRVLLTRSPRTPMFEPWSPPSAADMSHSTTPVFVL